MCRNQFIILALYIVHCSRHIFGRRILWVIVFVYVCKIGMIGIGYGSLINKQIGICVYVDRRADVW